MAFAGAVLLEQARPEEDPLPDAVRRAARLIGKTFVALRRDRLDVPEHLADAASALLMIYAAARTR